MNEINLIDWISQQGFAIAVAIWLLLERHKFNEKIVKSLEKIATILDKYER